MKRNKNADIRFLLQLFSKSQREKKKKNWKNFFRECRRFTIISTKSRK